MCDILLIWVFPELEGAVAKAIQLATWNTTGTVRQREFSRACMQTTREPSLLRFVSLEKL
jgi:hypothetical protein